MNRLPGAPSSTRLLGLHRSKASRSSALQADPGPWSQCAPNLGIEGFP